VTTDSQSSGTLPSFLSRFFWEVDFDNIRLPSRETYVIERLLEYGDDDAIRWVKKTFTPKAIATVVRKSSVISRRTANLWALVFGIPREEIRCFSTRSILQHGSFSDN
jgi:hypothetical protein